MQCCCALIFKSSGWFSSFVEATISAIHILYILVIPFALLKTPESLSNGKWSKPETILLEELDITAQEVNFNWM
uniref:Uncharacterized protein n=1 Tax=Anguilla anguilla TaxID=7936 RepID=A0A0E9T2R5_ANGAN